MSGRLKIAIVGRPNVGKSAILNALVGERIAIVDEGEGITRDRLYVPLDWKGIPLELIDTGGIDPSDSLPFGEQVRRQAEIAIEEADSLIFVVDGTTSPTEIDLKVATLLQKTSKPLILAVNKIDSSYQENLLIAYYSLGIPKILGVSALHKRGMNDLLAFATEGLPVPEKEDLIQGPRVAIVGRPNVGKSTLINTLLGEDRCIVSEQAGTTRDSIDVPITFHDKPYVLVDTAGIRRKHAEKEVVDKFAAVRTEQAIERSDICVLMLDAREGITTQEKRIAQRIEEASKGCIVFLNKWDLVPGFRMEHALRSLREEVPFLAHCPIYCISAKTGRNAELLFSSVDEVAEARSLRIGTGQLNRFIEQALAYQSPPMILGKRLRIYYMTQVGTCPPRFIIFVNHPRLMTETYKKYLIHKFRKTYAFSGNPLIFHLRSRDRDESKPNPVQESAQELSTIDL